MLNVRCRCGKIVCQLVNVPEAPKTESSGQAPPDSGPAIVLLCRHCKSYVVLEVAQITAVDTRSSALR